MNPKKEIKIDQALIEKVSILAKLDLTSEEKEKFINDFKEILNAFSKLDECNTDGIDEIMHPITIKHDIRKDIPKDSLSQKEAFTLAKSETDGYFKGPRVV